MIRIATTFRIAALQTNSVWRLQGLALAVAAALCVGVTVPAQAKDPFQPLILPPGFDPAGLPTEEPTEEEAKPDIFEQIAYIGYVQTVPSSRPLALISVAPDLLASVQMQEKPEPPTILLKFPGESFEVMGETVRVNAVASGVVKLSASNGEKRTVAMQPLRVELPKKPESEAAPPEIPAADPAAGSSGSPATPVSQDALRPAAEQILKGIKAQ
ncbi:MAG: hypothetical protein VKJ06_08905 [Vampirovibrionales bacterium]|nr:hypothetical protein [Vampirovibrionales bacterium]